MFETSCELMYYIYYGNPVHRLFFLFTSSKIRIYHESHGT